MNTQEAIGLLNYMLRDIDNDAPNGKNCIEAQALTHAIEHMKRWQWQPIETYDYETFPLVMLAGFITPSEYAQSNGSKPFWEISIGRCWHVNTRKFTGFLGQQPTHWMQLPEPPQERKD